MEIIYRCALKWKPYMIQQIHTHRIVHEMPSAPVHDCSTVDDGVLQREKRINNEWSWINGRMFVCVDSAMWYYIAQSNEFIQTDCTYAQKRYQCRILFALQYFHPHTRQSCGKVNYEHFANTCICSLEIWRTMRKKNVCMVWLPRKRWVNSS